MIRLILTPPLLLLRRRRRRVLVLVLVLVFRPPISNEVKKTSSKNGPAGGITGSGSGSGSVGVASTSTRFGQPKSETLPPPVSVKDGRDRGPTQVKVFENVKELWSKKEQEAQAAAAAQSGHGMGMGMSQGAKSQK